MLALMLAAAVADFAVETGTIRPALHSSGFGPTICSQTAQDLADVKSMAQWEYACRAGTATQWNVPSLSTGDETAAKGCRSAARAGSPYVNGDNGYAGFRVVAPIALKW